MNTKLNHNNQWNNEKSKKRKKERKKKKHTTQLFMQMIQCEWRESVWKKKEINK